MIKKIPISCSACVIDVPQHDRYKDYLLSEIKNFKEASRVVTPDGIENIANCDWEVSASVQRPYYDKMMEVLTPVVTDFLDEMGYKKAKWTNFWFQQYANDSYHDMHIHPYTMFNLVYYLDLKEEAPPTVIKTDAGLLYPDVKEGQALIFPSVFYHSSPQVKAASEAVYKTILASNFNVE